jgi:hypothetical protein
MSMLAALLIACPAERLGIELPPGGAASISREDLERDVALLVDGGRAAFGKRMEQMHFSASGECFERRGPDPLLVIVAPIPAGVDLAAAGAVAIAFAKGIDTMERVPRRVTICFADASLPAGERLELGAFAPGEIDWGPPIHAGVPDPGRPLGAIRYDALAEQARAVFQRAIGE